MHFNAMFSLAFLLNLPLAAAHLTPAINGAMDIDFYASITRNKTVGCLTSPLFFAYIPDDQKCTAWGACCRHLDRHAREHCGEVNAVCERIVKNVTAHVNGSEDEYEKMLKKNNSDVSWRLECLFERCPPLSVHGGWTEPETADRWQF